MKLFLTSAGLCTKELSDGFLEFSGPLDGKHVAYIPTAAENIRQSGVDEGVAPFEDMGAHVEVIDISKGESSEWISKLYDSHILCFGGGLEFRLMNYIVSTGLKDKMNELLQTRIWVGMSAGSMVTNPVLYGNVSQVLYEESPAHTPNVHGLEFVPFQFFPHLNSPDFPKLVAENIDSIAHTIPAHIYATDDNTALAVRDGTVTVVGGGLCREWNNAS